jgi:ribonuclease HII
MDMSVVVGIDEAGYGPVLGPLVVSAVAFETPESSPEPDLWERLSKAVTRDGRKKDRIQVNDSKIVYRNGDLGTLERNVLPFLAQGGALPSSLRMLSEQLESENRHCFDAYPWYVNRDASLPLSAEAEELRRLEETLRKALTGAGIKFRGARAELLDAAEFNLEIRQDQSKPVPLARRVSVLLGSFWKRHATEDLHVVVDKQGGRNFYGPMLRATFEDCRIEAIEETADCSEYLVWDHQRQASIRFVPRGDSHFMTVALASMLSKYLRELFMGLLNDYWLERVPGISRTAGYYTDGHRFINDIRSACEKEGIPMDILVRCR